MGGDLWWQPLHNLLNNESYKVKLAEGNCESLNLSISYHGCQGVWRCLQCLGEKLMA